MPLLGCLGFLEKISSDTSMPFLVRCNAASIPKLELNSDRDGAFDRSSLNLERDFGFLFLFLFLGPKFVAS